MRKFFLILVTLGTFTNPSFSAELFQNGPYYAQPSWDQQLPTTTRFIVLSNWNNEAVLDRETGLVWERAPETSPTDLWASAAALCRGRETGSRRGWRLPAYEELTSLLDRAQRNPALPAGHPFQGISPDDRFWTATSYEPNAQFAYVVRISDFSTLDIVPKDLGDSGSSSRYWCVRGGSNVSNPTL
jgi:hypothetical protein